MKILIAWYFLEIIIAIDLTQVYINVFALIDYNSIDANSYSVEMLVLASFTITKVVLG